MADLPSALPFWPWRCETWSVAELMGAAGANLVGRATELQFLSSFFDGAAAGQATTLVVSGDPGIGKTALVQWACAVRGADFRIFSGACLPLTTTPFPFLALHSAFKSEQWFNGGSAPHFSGSGDLPEDIPAALDGWLDHACQLMPVVLFIDDLHWADKSTLDVLMYLLAGPAERSLAIIVTMRTGEIGGNHPLHRWLADIRRMPRVMELRLHPLDRVDTEAQLATLLGALPHQSLLQEVFEHTAGNAYLNRLIVSGLDAGDRHLPSQLPSDLKGAVLRSWRSLTAEARRLTRLMAVGGGPLPSGDLDAVWQLDGGPPNILTLLHDAADAGIVECSADGNCWWFHHPLFAEVLQQDLDGGERMRWHGLFATFAETRLMTPTGSDFKSLVSLADHYYASGNTAEAYRCSLRAASADRHESGGPETLRLLRRAVDLRVELPDAAESVRELWFRLRLVAERIGDQDVELEAVEKLLFLLDSADEPLETAALLVRRALLGFSTGREFLSPAHVREAVQLAGTDEKSWQYAYALAEMAHAGLWKAVPEAPGQAAQALLVARIAGNPTALAYALTACSMSSLFAGQPAEARELAAEGATAAAQVRDFWALRHAILWQANATAPWTSQVFADLMRKGRRDMQKLGSPHPYLAQMAADEAGSFLAIGRWRECRQALRIALTSVPGALGDVAFRLNAARMAALQGRTAEAAAHLVRADEICSPDSDFTNLCFDAVRAEVLLAAGRPEAAYSAAMTGLALEGQPPTMCEWLVPSAARALADMIQLSHDDGRPVTDLANRLEALVRDFPSVVHESDDGEEYAKQILAFNRLYQAEVGRARGSDGNAQDWIAAADACAAVMLLWEESYSCWRAAESLLLHGHANSQLATRMLQRGFVLAQSLEARPIVERLDRLAKDARIPCTPVDIAVRPQRARLPGLTPREQEILEFVVSGRTYAEIAEALVISEKTVSSHISHLLQKTGAANRVDLARRATKT